MRMIKGLVSRTNLTEYENLFASLRYDLGCFTPVSMRRGVANYGRLLKVCGKVPPFSLSFVQMC